MIPISVFIFLPFSIFMKIMNVEDCSGDGNNEGTII